MRTLQAVSEVLVSVLLAQLAPSEARILISRTAHQKTPIVIHGYRGFLITRRSGTACKARMGSVSLLGDIQAKLVTSSLVRRRARKFSRSEIPVFNRFKEWLASDVNKRVLSRFQEEILKKENLYDIIRLSIFLPVDCIIAQI